MTRHTVVWHKDAVDELAEIWINAPNRAAVATAANAMDSNLADEPSTKGDELSEGLRVLIARPLQVLFAVNVDDRVAEILQVKLI